MKLNKKCFLALLTALGIQVMVGVSSAYATECYPVFRKSCIEDKSVRYDSRYFNCNMTEQEFSNKMYDIFESYSYYVMIDEALLGVVHGIRKGEENRNKFAVCYYETLEKYRKTGGVRPNSKASSNQSSSSGSSSQSNNNANQQSANNQSSSSNSQSQNQSSSAETPQPAAQTESSQSTTNTQTTNNKKSKKNPNDISANCVGFNHNKIKIVNKCNFPINFSYCMLHSDDQSIQVANSCNDGFVYETIYPGRAISDESLNTRFFAIACKFPSKPINMRFISFDKQVEGNCQR